MEYRDEETYHFFENQNKEDLNQDFEFQDSYWDEMELILNDHDSKRKKRRILAYIFSSIIILGFTTFGAFFFNSSDRLVQKEANNSSFLNKLDKQKQFDVNLVHSNVSLKHDHNQTKLLKKQKTNSKSSVKQTKNVLKEPLFTKPESKRELTDNSLVQKEKTKLSSMSNVDFKENLNRMEKKGGVKLTQSDINQNLLLEKRKVKNKLRHSIALKSEIGIVNVYASTDKLSYAVGLGIGYELGFHKNLSFQTGLNVVYRDGVDQNFRNESKVYGFHSRTYFQDIQYKGQVNLELPLALIVRMRKSSISAGVGISALLAVRSSLHQFTPESSESEKFNTNFGVRKGIRNMDIAVNLGYSYAVSRNLELTSGFSLGLLDQTDNKFFSNNSKDHNLQFRVGIKYHFFNR